MKKPHEERMRLVGGLLCMLVYPLVMGFAVTVAIFTEGMCIKSILMLAVWLASMVYLWSLPSILQKIGKKNEILRDERDIVIFKNAALTANAVSWLYFLSACLIIWRFVGANGSVSVNVLPLILVGGIVIFHFVLVFGSLIQDKLR